LSQAERAYIHALYLAEVEYVDQRVGCILAALEHRDLMENTFIVFTSDHGEAFWEHGFPSHGNTYFEEMVRVPLIFSGPGIVRGRKTIGDASLVDLAPTLAELLGVDLPGERQGRSLTGQFRRIPRDMGAQYLSSAHQQVQQDAIIDEGHKLICLDDGSTLLYDLHGNPGETEDLTAERPEVAARLMAKLTEIRVENRLLREGRSVGGESSDSGGLLEQMRALGYVE
jgi:choline-sulfatase